MGPKGTRLIQHTESTLPGTPGRSNTVTAPPHARRKSLAPAPTAAVGCLHPPPRPAPMPDVTQLLHAAERGDPHAADQLLPLVYAELRRLAAQKLAGEAAGQTLQPTALVHEAY